MKQKRKNEELQSRREFFKRAAKGALPILAAVALAGAPGIVKAAKDAPMGCNYNCSSTCQGSCHGTCRTGCKSTCYDQCYSHCKYTSK